MKDIRNKQLRNKLNKLGIKDVVLNFDSGFVSVWSEDDLTDTILHHADNTIETRMFGDYSVDEWVEMIKNIFDEGLDGYEHRHDFDKVIKIGKQFKEKKDTILHYADNTIETRIFGNYSVDEWVEMIKDIFDEGLDGYEHRHDFDKVIKIGKQFKEKKDTIHDVSSSKVYEVVTSWMKTHPKDMEILGK